jgi:hypothetical protein
MSRRGIPGRVPAEYDPGTDPRTRRFWNHNPPDYDYEPAPLEHNLAQARGVLARLYGTNLELIAQAEPGACEECSRQSERVRYGQFAVCRSCALRRRTVRDELTDGASEAA